MIRPTSRSFQSAWRFPRKECGHLDLGRWKPATADQQVTGQLGPGSEKRRFAEQHLSPLTECVRIRSIF